MSTVAIRTIPSCDLKINVITSDVNLKNSDSQTQVHESKDASPPAHQTQISPRNSSTFNPSLAALDEEDYPSDEYINSFRKSKMPLNVDTLHRHLINEMKEMITGETMMTTTETTTGMKKLLSRLSLVLTNTSPPPSLRSSPSLPSRYVPRLRHP